MDYGPICGLVLRRTTSPPPKLELDSAVSRWETPRSELVQCVLWGIVWRLALRMGVRYDWRSTCAVLLVALLCSRYTVTPPWAVERTIRWSHPIWALVYTTTVARLHWLFAAVSNAVSTTPPTLCAGCLPLLQWHFMFYIVLRKPYPRSVPASISLDTVLSLIHRILSSVYLLHLLYR